MRTCRDGLMYLDTERRHSALYLQTFPRTTVFLRPAFCLQREAAIKERENAVGCQPCTPAGRVPEFIHVAVSLWVSWWVDGSWERCSEQELLVDPLYGQRELSLYAVHPELDVGVPCLAAWWLSVRLPSPLR